MVGDKMDDLVQPSAAPQPIEVYNDFTIVLPTPEPESSPASTAMPEPTPEPSPAPVVSQSIDGGSAARGGVVGALVDVLGDYQPRTVTTTTTAADGSQVVSVTYADGLASLDWPWLGGLLLFSILTYGFIRIMGGILR